MITTSSTPKNKIGGIETSLHTVGGARVAVDCKVNTRAPAGHVTIVFVPERVIVSCGVGNERLNTVPKPALPPLYAVP